MAEDDPVRLDTRLSGQLQRYHTWPTIGIQTVGEHCWQILRIYLSVAEAPSLDIIRYIVFHDVGETATGDLPYPVKAKNPVLKEEVDVIESKSIAEQLQYWDTKFINLSFESKAFFK